MSKVLFRLFFVEDWKRYEKYMTEKSFSRIEMLEKLCDYSIQRLYHYCTSEVNCYNYTYQYFYELQGQCLYEIIKRELDLNILVHENKIVPLAPLFKYKSESWVKHPCEVFCYVS